MHTLLRRSVTVILLLACNAAYAGFATYSNDWPDDAAVVDEKADAVSTAVVEISAASDNGTAQQCELQVTQPVTRVPDQDHLYVKFGLMFATADARNILNLSQGPLAGAYLIQQSIKNNYVTWETGLGSRTKYFRWELEYVYNRDLTYNPNPIFTGQVEGLASNFTNIGFWFNLIYDFDTNAFVYFKPYVGALLGLSMNRTRSTMYNGLGTNIQQTHSNYSLGWGLTVGARTRFFERWFGYISYKYTDVGNMRWKDSTGVMQLKGSYIFSGFSVGVQYILG